LLLEKLLLLALCIEGGEEAACVKAAEDEDEDEGERVFEDDRVVSLVAGFLGEWMFLEWA
jgi:hypothetical protein